MLLFSICKLLPMLSMIILLFRWSTSLVENVALFGTCMMSTRETLSADCTAAIDNDTSLIYKEEVNGSKGNCLRTKNISDDSDNADLYCSPVWAVTLEDVYTILNVTIMTHFRKSTALAGIEIQVDGEECHFIAAGTPLKMVMDIACKKPIQGRTVTVKKYPVPGTDCYSNDTEHALLLCEVQVWVCSKGWYGIDCSIHCGENCISECSRIEGKCDGCDDGWFDTDCDKRCVQNCSSCDQRNGFCIDCDASLYGQKCTEVCGHCAGNETCNSTNGFCTNCKSGWKPPLCKEPLVEGLSDQAKWVIGLAAVLIPVAVALLIVYIIRRRNALQEEEEREKLREHADYGVLKPETVFQAYTPGPPWDPFQEFILARLISGQLHDEFLLIPSGVIHPCKEAHRTSNWKKNRSHLHITYDQSRVILKREGSSDTDYINASYIKGINGEKCYIATQNPLKDTVNDFWLMTWQENAFQIVMLTTWTELEEDSFVKYWPDKGVSVACGNITVSCKRESPRADFTIREILLKTTKGKVTQERLIEQYVYHSWSERGLPSAMSFVNFWRYVRSRVRPSFIPIVHCSGGTEKSGVFVALDIAMCMADDGMEINVLNIVSAMRDERSVMVPNVTEYVFLHVLIFEGYTSRFTRYTLDDFAEEFPVIIKTNAPNNIIDKEFRVLQQMKTFVPPPKNTISKAQENAPKIRNSIILPDDRHLVFLIDNYPGRNGYINAVGMPTFKRRDGTILTQLPLPSTRVDFWRLVDDKEISTIVSIGSHEEFETAQNFGQFWPSRTNDILSFGPFDIKCINASAVGEHLTMYELLLKVLKFSHKKLGKEQNVRIFHYTNWAEEVPGGTSDLIHLVKTIIKYRSENETAPIVVQCMDGAAKSGLFCILCEIVDRATYDQEIDVFMAARCAMIIRPQAVNEKTQYRYCYRVAQYLSAQDK